MPEETLGTESLKRAIDVAISFPIQAAKTIKAKFKVWDILAFMDEARELTEVIADKDNVISEFKDLTADEKAELIAYAKDSFDLPDDKVELFVENALMWVGSTLTLFKEAKALKVKKP